MERAIWKWRVKHHTKWQHIRKLFIHGRVTRKRRENQNIKGIVWIILWVYFSNIWSIHVFAASIRQSREVASPHNLSCSSGNAHNDDSGFRHETYWWCEQNLASVEAYLPTNKLASGNVPQFWTEIIYTSKLKCSLSYFQPEPTNLPSCCPGYRTSTL